MREWAKFVMLSDHPEVLRAALSRELRSDSPDTRLRALEDADGIGWEFRELADQLCADPSIRVRLLAGLSCKRPEVLRAIAMSLLAGRNPEAQIDRKSAVLFLRGFPDPETHRALCAIALSPLEDVGVRAEATEAIGHQRKPEAVRLLVRVMDSPAPAEPAYLERMSPGLMSYLANDDVRAFAARELGLLGRKPALPGLRRASRGTMPSCSGGKQPPLSLDSASPPTWSEFERPAGRRSRGTSHSRSSIAPFA